MREIQIPHASWKYCPTFSEAGVFFLLCTTTLVGCYKKNSGPGCRSNEDCDDTQYCREGECVPRCNTNSECDDGSDCSHDVCEFPESECRHYPVPAGTLCRAKLPGNVCDIEAETCDGTSPECPEDTFEPSTVECRPAAGPCDEPEYCTGVSPLCPDDAFSPFGTECDDGDPCTNDDKCDGGGGCVGTNVC
jgi:hypothetical protein